jgi:hypothetical protein
LPGLGSFHLVYLERKMPCGNVENSSMATNKHQSISSRAPYMILHTKIGWRKVKICPLWLSIISEFAKAGN